MSIPNGTAGPGVPGLFPISAWRESPALRSWPVLLFLALICVPAIALVVLGQSPTGTSFEDAAWIFAAYFAVAWLLLLGVVIRPEHVTRPMLAVITVVALITEIPLALALETALNADSSNLFSSIFTIGVPEELAKAVPIVAVAMIYRRSQSLGPRDYLFLGAVSGLVFGASEAVHYFTTNVQDQLAQVVVQQIAPNIAQLYNGGDSLNNAVFNSVLGPLLFFVISFVWRFLTDPIGHACWSGLTGYFIGLALTGRYKWYRVGWIGFALAAVLHGLNDWDPVNDQWAWVLVVLVSGLLFLGYAKAGPAEARQQAGLTAAAATTTAPAASQAPAPAGPATSAQPSGQHGQAGQHGHVPQPSATGPATSAAPAAAGSAAWWQAAPAPGAGLAVQTAAATVTVPAATVPPQRPAPRPWWEQ
jgi:RsiW-degrading membrane proteinase PrsW (M82 family)